MHVFVTAEHYLRFKESLKYLYLKMSITVKELISTPFLNRSKENKIEIVIGGKPRPLLNMSTVTVNASGEMKIETFDPVMYDQVPWLTGCETEKSFYCWPCLLFSQGNELWKVTDLVFLLEGISEHEKTVEHIRALFRLKMFSSEHLKVEKLIWENDQYSQISCKVTKTMKLLIDAIFCSIAAEDQSFLRGNYGRNHIKPDICVKALNIIKLCNKSSTHFEYANEMIKMYPTLLDDLVDAITEVMKLAVMKEVRMSTYAALIISNHSMNPEKTHFSVVLRYINKAKVCERFLGFIILSVKSTDIIDDIIKNTISAFGITNKFLAYSFDGAVLEINKLINLNNVLQKKYPQSYFVPCYFQRILHIIEQSLSAHKELTQFFKILGVMEAYFKEDSKQRKEFEHFMNLNTIGENSNWYVNAPFIKNVRWSRNHFIEALKSIIKNCTLWSADDYAKAHGLIRFLEEFHTVCLLHILSPLFEYVMRLDEALRKLSPELEFRSDLVAAIMNDLLREKDRFEEYFSSAINEMNKLNNDDQESRQLNIDYNDLKGPFQALFITIIEHLEKEIMLRFGKLDDLSFCSLANAHAIAIHRQKLDHWYWKMNVAPVHNFKAQQFHSEFIVQRTNQIFNNKNAYDLLSLFENLNFKNVFKCTNRLLEFALTMPFNTSVPNGDLSKFRKIECYFCPSTHVTNRGDASVLYVESDLLRDLRSDVFFYDEVVRILYELNKRK